MSQKYWILIKISSKRLNRTKWTVVNFTVSVASEPAIGKYSSNYHFCTSRDVIESFWSGGHYWKRCILKAWILAKHHLIDTDLSVIITTMLKQIFSKIRVM